MKKILIIFLLGVLFAPPAFSLENELKTYPVKGVFVADNIASDEFRELFAQPSVKDLFISNFLQQYKNYYNNINDEITDRNKYKTIVSYVSIPRVSKYIDNRPDKTLIYLPLTVSLNFVNMVTGDVLYSTSSTQYDLTTKNDVDVINNKYIENYNEALKKVLSEAKVNFNPFEIETQVIGKYKDVVILNKGTSAGIANDDLLFDEQNNQLVVIYSNLDYSVARPLLNGEIKHNTTFKKQTNEGSVSQIKKVRVLMINDFGDNSLYDLLATSLGKNSIVNLVTLNTTFSKVQNAVVASNDKFTMQNIYKKELPDYYMLFKLTPPIKKNIRINQSGLHSTAQNMLGCGTIFDKTGEIVFSKCVDDSTKPRFNNEEYKVGEADIVEILKKNLVFKLAEEINQTIEFKDFEYPIKKVDKDVLVLDNKSKNLKIDSKITVYKKIKADNNVEYLVPTFEYAVYDIQKNVALCKMIAPYIEGVEQPAKSNIAATTSIVSSAGVNSYIVDSKNIDVNSDIRVEHLSDYITYMIGSGLKKPLMLENNVLAEKTNKINSSGTFKNKLTIKENNNELVIKPMYKIELKKHKAKSYTKIDTYTITAGLKVYDGSNLLNSKELSQEITLELPIKREKEILEYELMKAMYPLFETLAKSI